QIPSPTRARTKIVPTAKPPWAHFPFSLGTMKVARARNKITSAIHSKSAAAGTIDPKKTSSVNRTALSALSRALRKEAAPHVRRARSKSLATADLPERKPGFGPRNIRLERANSASHKALTAKTNRKNP